MNIIEIIHADEIKEVAETRARELGRKWKETQEVEKQKAKRILSLHIEKINEKIQESARMGDKKLKIIINKRDEFWNYYQHNIDDILATFRLAGYHINHITRREGGSYYRKGQIGCFEISWEGR